MQLQTIQNRIYEVRGQKIMFDFDLADRLTELEGEFSDVTQAINYLLQKDKQETEQRERKRIGFKTGSNK